MCYNFAAKKFPVCRSNWSTAEYLHDNLHNVKEKFCEGLSLIFTRDGGTSLSILFMPK